MSPQAATAMDSVRTVLIPTGPCSLLLPNAAVAEVVRNFDLDDLSFEGVDWLLGQVEWRKVSVPVLSFPVMIDEPVPVEIKRPRLVVCYTINGDRKLPYLGLVATGMPRLVMADAYSLKPIDLDVDNPYVLQRVEINQELALIPDLDAIEQLVRAGTIL
jgi:chemosensory pili system protein ChpC